jgi:hypothetical protein
VLHRRAFETPERALVVPARREQESAAAGKNRERPRAVEGTSALLPCRKHVLRLVEFTGRDQRLEQVAELESCAWLEEE